MYRIKFSNEIMIDHVRIKGEHRCRYEIFNVKQDKNFNIFNGISDHVMLVQLIDTAGNVNHVVSITGCWIYD